MSHGQALLAHHDNDEVLERIYIGRRCKSEPEQLEKLSELCAKMTGAKAIGEGKRHERDLGFLI